MGLGLIVLISIGLAMDAFAVSICKGLSISKPKIKYYLSVAVWFGLFQAGMPLIGYFLGKSFSTIVDSFDHWIAFLLLVVIGGNMIRESLSKEQEEHSDSFSFMTMLLLAIATSIDALAVGVTMGLSDLKISIFLAVGVIGVITAVLSAIGFKIGNVFGVKYKSKAEFIGGIILVLIGIKTLIDGLI